MGTRGVPPAMLPNTGSDVGTRGLPPAMLLNTSYDGGPEEGTRGINLVPQASASSGVEAKHEAASAAAIGQSNDGTVTRGSKTDPHGPASLLR